MSSKEVEEQNPDNFVDLTLDDDEPLSPIEENSPGQGAANPMVSIKKEDEDALSARSYTADEYEPIAISSLALPTASATSATSNSSNEHPNDEEASFAMDDEMPARTMKEWSVLEKERLADAKRNGLTWKLIQEKHFPYRTVYACINAYRRFFTNSDRDHEDERDVEEHIGLQEHHVATSERNEAQPIWSPREKELLATLVKKYGKDWKKIQMFISGRTANACCAAYVKYLQQKGGSYRNSGHSKRPPWQEDELHKLAKMAQKHGRKWDIIQQYFPGRSANSCSTAFSRYVDDDDRDREHTTKAQAREWTAQEKLIFHKAYNKNKNDWDRIAAAVGRSQSEIADYYDYVYLPELMKMASERYSAAAGTNEGRSPTPENIPEEQTETFNILPRESSRISWTKEEEELLCEQYEKYWPLFNQGKIKYGGIFEYVAQHMPGRSVGACKEHFRRHFPDRKRERNSFGYESDVSNAELPVCKKSKTTASEGASVAKGIWTDQEKEKFHKLFMELGTNNWEAIADRMPGRDIQSCKNYYYRVYRFLKTSEPEQCLEEDVANRVERTERSERHEPLRTRDVVFSAAVPRKRAASVFTKSDIRTQLYAMISAMGSNSADRVAAMKVLRFLGDKNLNEIIEDIILQIQVDKPAMTAQAATLAFYAQALEVMKESENWKS